MTRKPLTKQDFERICRNGGCLPVARANFMGREIFVADGFSAPPHWKLRHFGVGPKQYPFGAYLTFWWVARGDEELANGAAIHCDAMHNPEYSTEDKQRLRINTAMKEAREFIQRKQRVQLNG